MAAVSETHFVIFYGHFWRDLLDSDEQGKLPPAPRDLAPYILNNEDCWIVLTYVQLRRRGLRVRLWDVYHLSTMCRIFCQRILPDPPLRSNLEAVDRLRSLVQALY
jgi:hypothetical protein